MDGLDRAIDVNERAVKLSSESHSQNAQCSSGLGILLQRRFERAGAIMDLDPAIKTAEQAVKSMSNLLILPWQFWGIVASIWNVRICR